MARQRAFYDRVYSAVLRGAYDVRVEDVTNYVVGSEDCLFLNIWSTSLDAGAKMPVILWVHPGALWAWSGVSAWTDGGNLARQENVVVVSFNHRLGPFGFLYLGGLGQQDYDEAANPGLLDMIFVLRWLKENIAAFGGDPDNVTLMGESGGAAKVCNLLASRLAVGLFHKAIVMGGTAVRAYSRARAAQRTAELLDTLGISKAVFRDLQRVPAEEILRAVRDVYPSIVVAEPTMSRHPFDPEAQGISAHVPILVGTTTDEMTYLTLKEDFPDELDEQSARTRLIAVGWGFDSGAADLVFAAARRLEPAADWRRIFTLAATASYRDDHFVMVERRLAMQASPVFMYLFDWKCPAFGGRYGAMHVLDVPFAFSNLQAAAQILGPEPDPRVHDLAGNMSKAWASFARNGRPEYRGLPDWPAYSFQRRETMVLDHISRVVNDPLSDVRIAFEEVRETRLAARDAANS